MGLALTAHLSGQIEAPFWFVALAMLACNLLPLALNEETHHRLNLG